MLQLLLSVAVVTGASVLFCLLSLTHRIRRTILANCRYKDGHWSINRARREFRSFLRYYSNLNFPCFLAFSAMFVALQYLNDQIPLKVAIEGMSKFDPNPQIWKDNLSDVRKEHTESLQKNKGLSADQITTIQRELWDQWPSIVVLLAGLAILSVWCVVGGAKHSVVEYVQGIRRRRGDYRWKDICEL